MKLFLDFIIYQYLDLSGIKICRSYMTFLSCFSLDFNDIINSKKKPTDFVNCCISPFNYSILLKIIKGTPNGASKAKIDV